MAATGAQTSCIASHTALDCCTAPASRRTMRSTAREHATIRFPSRSSGGRGCRSLRWSLPSRARARASACNPCRQRTARLSASCTLAFGSRPRATCTQPTSRPPVAARRTTSPTPAHGRRRSSGVDCAVPRPLPHKPPAPTTRTPPCSATTPPRAETIASTAIRRVVSVDTVLGTAPTHVCAIIVMTLGG